MHISSKDTGIPGTTSVYQQEFFVPYSFPVVFTRGLFREANPAFRDALARLEPGKRHRCLVFLDDRLEEARPQLAGEIAAYFAAHKNSLDLVAPPVSVPGGERIKSELHFVEDMQRKLFDHHIDRHSYVVAVGGGAMLDAVGLVAATTHRGVRHVRVPSTVLSQNDSGVGVKNGVNLYDVKNFVGTFSPPFAVLNDFDLIDGLPAREKIAGMAEAVKVALIRDGAFFEWLEGHADDLATFDPPAMEHMIRRCAELHMHQIGKGGDPFETGSARPLDFGHWSAHRLETLSRYHLRHGEAVAIGIALDTHYSVLRGLLEPGAEERVCWLLEHLGFKLWHPALERRDADGTLSVWRGLQEFREHLGGELTITLLRGIGEGFEVHEMDEDTVMNAISRLKERATA